MEQVWCFQPVDISIVFECLNQLAGAHADQMMRCAELFSNEVKVDFVDLNLGCPLDLICDQGRSVCLVFGRGDNSRKLCVFASCLHFMTSFDLGTFLHVDLCGLRSISLPRLFQ